MSIIKTKAHRGEGKTDERYETEFKYLNISPHVGLLEQFSNICYQLFKILIQRGFDLS